MSLKTGRKIRTTIHNCCWIIFILWLNKDFGFQYCQSGNFCKSYIDLFCRIFFFLFWMQKYLVFVLSLIQCLKSKAKKKGLICLSVHMHWPFSALLIFISQQNKNQNYGTTQILVNARHLRFFFFTFTLLLSFHYHSCSLQRCCFYNYHYLIFLWYMIYWK